MHGSCSATANFLRPMETVVARLNWQIYLIYLDGVIVIEKSFHGMSWQSGAGVE